MIPTNRQTFARDLLYRLKRDFGSPVEIYTQTAETADYATGRKTVSIQKWKIRKAVVLPKDNSNPSRLAAALASVFRTGGLVEECDVRVLVDRRDIKGVEVGIENWWLLIEGVRYQMVKSEDYGLGVAYLLSANNDSGQRRAIVDMTVKSRIHVGSEGDAT